MVLNRKDRTMPQTNKQPLLYTVGRITAVLLVVYGVILNSGMRTPTYFIVAGMLFLCAETMAWKRLLIDIRGELRIANGSTAVKNTLADILSSGLSEYPEHFDDDDLTEEDIMTVPTVKEPIQ